MALISSLKYLLVSVRVNLKMRFNDICRMVSVFITWAALKWVVFYSDISYEVYYDRNLR